MPAVMISLAPQSLATANAASLEAECVGTLLRGYRTFAATCRRGQRLLLPLALGIALGAFVFCAPAFAAHSASCPRECAECAKTVKESLDWLAGQQHKDGYWIAGGPSAYLAKSKNTPPPDGVVHGSASKYLGMWVATGGAVLAFHAGGSTIKDGPYKDNIRRAVEYMVEHAPKAQQYKAFPLMNWDTAFIALAVAETYAHHPDPKLKEFLTWLADLIDKNQDPPTRTYGPGGWSHHARRYGDLGPTNNRYGAHVAPTVWNVAALGILRQLGIPVNEDGLKRGAYYLLCSAAKKGGSMYYGISPDVPLGMPPEPGRTAGALWALHRAGVTDDPVQKKMAEYLSASLKSLHTSHGAVIMHYLWGALAGQTLGEPLRGQFWTIYRDKMLRERKEDGSFENRWLKGETIWWYELSMGNNWSSAMFPLIIQVQAGAPHLKTWFAKAPPLKVDSPIALVRAKPGGAPPLNEEKSAPPPPLPPPSEEVRANTSDLGAVLQDLSSGGVLIVALGEESLLADAGLEAGDVVTSVNGQAVKSAAQLAQLINDAKPQAVLTVQFSRHGKISVVKIRR